MSSYRVKVFIAVLIVLSLTCLTVGRGTSPPINTNRVPVRVTCVMSIRIVCEDAVSRAVGLVVVGWTIPLVTYVQVHIGTTRTTVHVCVVVVVFGWVIKVVVAVVHNGIVSPIFVHCFEVKLVIILCVCMWGGGGGEM